MGQSCYSVTGVSSELRDRKTVCEFDKTYTCYCPSPSKHVYKITHDQVQVNEDEKMKIDTLRSYIKLIFVRWKKKEYLNLGYDCVHVYYKCSECKTMGCSVYDFT